MHARKIPNAVNTRSEGETVKGKEGGNRKRVSKRRDGEGREKEGGRKRVKKGKEGKGGKR